MGRHSASSTKRCVASRVRRRSSYWLSCFTLIDAGNSIVSVARLKKMSRSALSKRYGAWRRAREGGDEMGMKTATLDQRGTHRRIFTLREEQQLAANIRSLISSQSDIVTHKRVVAMGLDYWSYLHPSAPTRFRPVPSFSDGWVSGFKTRHRLISHPVRITKRVNEVKKRDLYDQLCDYSFLVRQAIEDYGESKVVNMDETAAKTIQHPLTGWSTVEESYVNVQVVGSDKESVSLVCAVDAAGKKLDLCAIRKGKTLRVVNKMGPLPSRLHAFYSENGWMNTGVMLRWMDEVLRPYLGVDVSEDEEREDTVAALVMDRFTAHCTAEVVRKGYTVDFCPWWCYIDCPALGHQCDGSI